MKWAMFWLKGVQLRNGSKMLRIREQDFLSERGFGAVVVLFGVFPDIGNTSVPHPTPSYSGSGVPLTPVPTQSSVCGSGSKFCSEVGRLVTRSYDQQWLDLMFSCWLYFALLYRSPETISTVSDSVSQVAEYSHHWTPDAVGMPCVRPTECKLSSYPALFRSASWVLESTLSLTQGACYHLSQT